MIIFKFNRYTFLEKSDLIKEGSEFLQYQFGIEPMGTQGGGGQYAFAQDPRSSYYNYQDSPYVDFYARQSGLVANLSNIVKNNIKNYGAIYKDDDNFLKDISLYNNIKILRIFENNNLKVDVFISFEYDSEEYFGVLRSFNGLAKPKFETELYYDTEHQYKFDNEYRLKLGNFFYKKLEKWFIPEKGFYRNSKNNNIVKDYMGKSIEIKENQIVDVAGYNKTTDNKPYIILNIKGKVYHIENNDYYYFKWRFEKVN